jgi:hypothetical protein
MHEFHADRDHAMSNIQNRSIPVVQLTQLRKLSNKNLGTGVSQKLTLMPSITAQSGGTAMEVPV